MRREMERQFEQWFKDVGAKAPETIERVITTAKQSRYSPEIIVVNAFSSDRTVELARKAGGIVIQQDAKTFPAKGIAMKTGLREAIKNKADIYTLSWCRHKESDSGMDR